MTSAPADVEVSPEVAPILSKLESIRADLKKLKEGGDKYNLDALHTLQEDLDAIDTAREDGIFGGSLKTQIPDGQAACSEVLDDAYDLVAELIGIASEMPPEVKHIYNTLSGIKRKLTMLKSDRSHSLEDIHHYQLMVDSIDNKRVDGIFGGSPQTSIPPGQAQCSALLFQSYELIRQLLLTAHDMNGEMRGIYSHLLGIKRKLTEIKVKRTKHASEDLHIFQLQLDAIDKDRVEGIFAGSPQTKIPAGQAVCATLLAQCYKLVQDLQETATDV